MSGSIDLQLPGDPGGIDAAGTFMFQVSEAINTSVNASKEAVTLSSSFWEGPAADTYRALAGGPQADARLVAVATDTAAALWAYADELRRVQAELDAIGALCARYGMVLSGRTVSLPADADSMTRRRFDQARGLVDKLVAELKAWIAEHFDQPAADMVEALVGTAGTATDLAGMVMDFGQRDLAKKLAEAGIANAPELPALEALAKKVEIAGKIVTGVSAVKSLYEGETVTAVLTDLGRMKLATMAGTQAAKLFAANPLAAAGSGLVTTMVAKGLLDFLYDSGGSSAMELELDWQFTPKMEDSAKWEYKDPVTNKPKDPVYIRR